MTDWTRPVAKSSSSRSDPARARDGGGRDFSATTAMPGHLLRRCQQIAVSLFHQECRGLDLTPVQFVILSALDHHGAIDQARLGGLTALDRTTVGGVIGKLEARGLINRRRSTTDRRANRITCTAKGRRLLMRAVPAVEAAQARILSPLSPAAQKRFLADLRRIADENNQQSRAPLRS